jgi:thiol:disulfide interchange protein DsbD
MLRELTRRVLFVAAVALGLAASAGAQTPVIWSASAPAADVRPGQTVAVAVSVRMESGWHIYSLQQPPPPVATRISLPDGQPFTLAGPVQGPPARKAYDASFGIETELYEGEIAFSVPVRVGAETPAGEQTLRLQGYYQTCNDRICLPPKKVPLEVRLTVAAGPAGAKRGASATSTAAPRSPETPGRGARPAVERPAGPSAPVTAAPSSSLAPGGSASATPPGAPASTPGAASSPVPGSPSPAGGTPFPASPAGGRSLWAFIWLAMTVGALSLLTPCVFPMVPITVSYFTAHAAGSRTKALQQAATYAGGIVLTFTALGMALALLVGATSLNRFAANPWINLLITAIFLGFALSLLGIFDVQVPPALVSRLDALTRRRGGSRTVASLLMGLTFTLTSFTCTAPFVGTLLVMAAGGDWQWPLAGMLAFSTVFALPFFVLALMPQWMARLPRSGGWLNSVKVMMAFLEIAAAMKFISNVDLVWHWGIFTRDVVLASWVVIGLLMALYVLGLFRFRHEAPVAHVGFVRLAAALLCGTAAIWLLTGLFGRRLGEIEAFLPPAAEVTVEASAGAGDELPWVMNDFEDGLARARREGRRVFVDFTGYTCTNCRWMEANMFTRPDVRRELRNFVLVRLYTDGDGELYLRQQRLQQARYQTVALPFYAIVTGSGKPVADFPGLTRDPAQFVAFLREGRSRPMADHE